MFVRIRRWISSKTDGKQLWNWFHNSLGITIVLLISFSGTYATFLFTFYEYFLKYCRMMTVNVLRGTFFYQYSCNWYIHLYAVIRCLLHKSLNFVFRFRKLWSISEAYYLICIYSNLAFERVVTDVDIENSVFFFLRIPFRFVSPEIDSRPFWPNERATSITCYSRRKRKTPKIGVKNNRSINSKHSDKSRVTTPAGNCFF